MHIRTIRIEDADDPDIHLVLPIIIEKERFSTTLTFVITRPDADWVHLSPV